MAYGDLLRLLDRVAAMDHSAHDCFALIMLSHGNEGTLFAYDAAFPTQKLWEPFIASRYESSNRTLTFVDDCASFRSPTLAGKPKMFFLQACQGNRMDRGIPITKASNS